MDAKEYAELQALREEVARLRAAQPAGSGAVPVRPAIAEMSAKVEASNPYSRLMALSKMGIVADYARIRDFTVVVVGVGGVGSVAAEMLTRCGVGRLVVLDYDKVELANLNRLFYTAAHVGLTKVHACAAQLRLINPDTDVQAHALDVTSPAAYDQLADLLLRGGKGGRRVDLLLSCVDNFEARMALNRLCNEHSQEWLESGVSEDAVSAHIQHVLPGRTACFACAPPLQVATGISERSLKREGVCAASLPTTMAICAGLLVQNALKRLLGFGQLAEFVGYAALRDHFPTYAIKPNPHCQDRFCLERQREAAAKPVVAPKPEAAPADAAPTHAANDWGIVVVREPAADKKHEHEHKGEHQHSHGHGHGHGHTHEHKEALPEGLSHEFERAAAPRPEELVKPAAGADLDSLMAQLKGLSGK